MLKSPFPENIAFAEARISEVNKQDSKNSRNLEFLAGRLAAARSLGLDPAKSSIEKDPRGAPIWPEGIVGSIAHTREIAVAATGSTADYKAIGLDLEEISRFTDPKLDERICRPAELAWVRAVIGKEQELRRAAIFSGKEAIYKAWAPVVGRRIGFLEAEIDCSKFPRCTAKLNGTTELVLSYVVEGELVVAGAFVACS